MSLAWKAKWGTISGFTGFNMNFDNITWYDDTIFAMPSRLDLPVDYKVTSFPTIASYFNHRGESPGWVAETMLGAMGSEYYLINIFLTSSSFSFLTHGAFESLGSVCPNTIDAVKNAPGLKIVCEIPGLDLVASAIQESNVVIYLYRKSTGDMITYFNPCCMSSNGAYLKYLVYVGSGTEKEDLINPANYKGIGVLFQGNPADKIFGYYVCASTGNGGEFNLVKYLFSSFSPPDANLPVDTDPYSPGGNTGIGGGGGSFSDKSDNIGFSGVPDYDVGSSGFVSLLAPTTAQLKNLASYMWDTLNMENWKKIFADPIDAIIGLTLVPCAVTRGGTTSVKVGNIDTGVEMSTLSSQIAVVDCGSLAVSEYFASYLDYDPYTKMDIFLPFIGYRPIKADEVMGKTIHVKYYVDLLSGACNAQVVCGTNLLYSFAGSVGYQVPITSNNWSNWLQSVISLSGAAITTIATGGAAAPMTAGTAATASVNMFKQNVDRSGTLAGNAGYLSQLTPYLVITRPKLAVPKDQNKFMGYPSLIASSLGDLSGYTEIKEIHLENIPCTEEELSEIESLLKGGVIL